MSGESGVKLSGAESLSSEGVGERTSSESGLRRLHEINSRPENDKACIILPNIKQQDFCR